MGVVYRAKSFITDASAHSDTGTDRRGNKSMSGLLEDYLEIQDAGGGSTSMHEVTSVSSCKLNGDRVFTIVVIEDQTSGG